MWAILKVAIPETIPRRFNCYFWRKRATLEIVSEQFKMKPSVVVICFLLKKVS
jgi:hypothetical protein